MSDGFLHKYFLNNSGKRLHKWMHYFDIYEHHFDRFRDKAPTIIEIGVFGGGSLAMWKDYFGLGAKIIGIDIDPTCKEHEQPGIEIFIGSQDDPAILDLILSKHPDIDMVLDDGSHQMRHMITSFQYLYPRISPRGCYMVEDTHTCYWDEYEGGLKRPGSFMEFVKDRLDDINAFHAREAILPSEFTKTTQSITTYDSIVVFEKRPQGMRQAPITGSIEAIRE
ncbi:class I SAM-dependent methyltransferase [Ochrobactrum sp. Q0168]|uniref:class I SAM-dependent methyltransferase n=1 Tax=Ochrobactrum sp. Q0168 TaxID=2793241 RepID=UPI0018EAA78C|nr:class I SAM-dependent methyltransferase [Ochrobactrum sp. Q0168]